MILGIILIGYGIVSDLASPANRGSYMSAVSFLCVTSLASSRIIQIDNTKCYHRTKPWACTWRRPDVCCWLGMDFLVSHRRHHLGSGAHRLLSSRDKQEYSGERISPTTVDSETSDPFHKLYAASSSQKKVRGYGSPHAQSFSVSQNTVSKRQRSGRTSLGPHVCCLFRVGPMNTGQR